MDIISVLISLLFVGGVIFTIAGALDPAGDPVGWMQDKITSIRARFR